jgi:voltage-gated potassium channel
MKSRAAPRFNLTMRGELGRPATRNVRRPNPIDRRMARFLREPPSVRMAASVIVAATVVVVVGGGMLIRVLDHSEYPTVWTGMWWAIQTVTTVGYGDVTPKHVSGRLVAALVMLEGIAFIAIITAAITSTFVARAEREQAAGADAEDAALEARINARFDRLEAMLRERGK